MELISMASISQKEINYLRNNTNTGIEFEYALFYLLNESNARSIFKGEVVAFHPFKERIDSIVSSANIDNLKKFLNDTSWDNFEVYLATQVDDIGPADIVLKNKTGQQLGLSIKYQNNCTLNVSSKYFISEQSTKELKNQLEISCQNYILEMNSKFGRSIEWFRKRKKSVENEMFIDKVRDKVINDWTKKTNNEKKNLLEKLVHADSPINFWVIKFSDKKEGFNLGVNQSPIKKFIPEDVTLTKEATSFIGFRTNGILFAKMQVKFNNGILEKAKGNSFDFLNDGIRMKKGDPFGSWNFNI